jgi:hypothetical protein
MNELNTAYPILFEKNRGYNTVIFLRLFGVLD